MTKTMSAQSAALTVACTAAMLLCGCSARTPEHLAQVQLGTGGSGTSSVADSRSSASTSAAQTGERYDPAAEEVIANESLKAWRIATAHRKPAAGQSDADWKQQQNLDEKNSMAELQALSKEHPFSSTVYFMMGQVEENFGKNKEAVTYFAKSRAKNTINPVSLFKLAENERLAGNLKEATEHFQQLYQTEPDFYPGRLGLAECLLKSKPAQAAQLAQSILDNASEDPDAVDRCKEILRETKGSKPER